MCATVSCVGHLIVRWSISTVPCSPSDRTSVPSAIFAPSASSVQVVTSLSPSQRLVDRFRRLPDSRFTFSCPSVVSCTTCDALSWIVSIGSLCVMTIGGAFGSGGGGGGGGGGAVGSGFLSGVLVCVVFALSLRHRPVKSGFSAAAMMANAANQTAQTTLHPRRMCRADMATFSFFYFLAGRIFYARGAPTPTRLGSRLSPLAD